MTDAYDRDLATWTANTEGRRARWNVARGAGLTCFFCPTRIEGGEPYRHVTKLDRPCCTRCAKARYDEDPPDDLPVVKVIDQLRAPSTFARYTPALAFEREREPGEEG